LLDLMSGRAEVKLALALSEVRETPAFTVSYTGPRDGLKRTLEADAFKARLKAKALREEMARLEELQREEERLIAEEMKREAEERREAEKARRAREREDDLNGVLGVVLSELNRQEMERRERELALWRNPPSPSGPETALPDASLFQLSPEPRTLRTPEPASAPQPKPVAPDETRVLAPAAEDVATKTLPEIKGEPAGGRRYRTNFNLR
jgi:hypothetical protein